MSFYRLPTEGLTSETATAGTSKRKGSVQRSRSSPAYQRAELREQCIRGTRADGTTLPVVVPVVVSGRGSGVVVAVVVVDKV